MFDHDHTEYLAMRNSSSSRLFLRMRHVTNRVKERLPAFLLHEKMVIGFH